MGGVIKTEFRAHFTAGHHLPTLFCHQINLKALLLSRNESNLDFSLDRNRIEFKKCNDNLNNHQNNGFREVLA